jgi:hypothetical protein
MEIPITNRMSFMMVGSAWGWEWQGKECSDPKNLSEELKLAAVKLPWVQIFII